MPIEYRIEDGRRLVIASVRGALTTEDIFGYQREVWGRPEVAGYDELIDLSEVEQLPSPSGASVMELARVASKMDAGAAAKLAIVAPDDYAYGLGRMYEAYRNMHGGKEARVFRTLQEARDWIGAEHADG